MLLYIWSALWHAIYNHNTIQYYWHNGSTYCNALFAIMLFLCFRIIVLTPRACVCSGCLFNMMQYWDTHCWSFCDNIYVGFFSAFGEHENLRFRCVIHIWTGWCCFLFVPDIITYSLIKSYFRCANILTDVFCDVIFVDCSCTHKLAQKRSSLVKNNRG